MDLSLVDELSVSQCASRADSITQALQPVRRYRSASLRLATYWLPLAYLGQFDFVYCVPEAYLSVPFTFLGKLIHRYPKLIGHLTSLCRYYHGGRLERELHQAQYV